MQFDGKKFLEQFKEDQFFVAFLKGKKDWFPICLPASEEAADMIPGRLCVSRDEHTIKKIAEYLREQVSSAEGMEVLYLFPVEIGNLLKRYGLSKIELLD